MIGCKFGRLRVVDRAANTAVGKTTWKCICDCGGKAIVRGDALKNGNTRSCGCLKIEAMRKIGQSNHIHGASYTIEYNSWASMLARCYDKNNNRFYRYGAMGVTVCKRWQESFSAFLSDMGYRPSRSHSLDRINPDGNYKPSNCRWATPLQQRHNRRRTK